MADTVSRRGFVVAVLPLTASSYSRIAGANDRIQVGQIGCGHRASGHRRMLKLSLGTDPNFDLRSVCDIWSVNREKGASHAEKLFGRRADKRRKLYNGRIECQYFQYRGARSVPGGAGS